MRNQIVILAAGKGTRMGDTQIPKVLINLKQRPIILHLLETVEQVNQLAKPVIVVGFRHADVMAVLGDGYEYALQERQLGTGHAVMCAEKKITGENILVLYGDMPFIQAESLKKLMRLHHQQSAMLSMFTTVVPHFADEFISLNNYGRIIRDVYGNIVKITEYKDATKQERAILEVNPGIYMFNTAWLFDHVAKIQNHNVQQEYYLTDIVELAMQDGQYIQSLRINPKEVLGINTLEQLELAERQF